MKMAADYRTKWGLERNWVMILVPYGSIRQGIMTPAMLQRLLKIGDAAILTINLGTNSL